MNEVLLSVGIDLGTTTTQIVFSKLEIENDATVFTVPRIRIVDKKIIYRGGIYMTPLLNRNTVDIQKVRLFIESEYKKAGVTPGDVSIGAVIITGETARKENSELAINTLRGFAGDFVVATAGSDLEAILAGRGAGTADMSRGTWDRALVNLDVGGGTANIAVFKSGAPVDTSCLDIGGRQIIIDPKTETLVYVAEKISILAERMGLKIAEGEKAARQDIERLCARLAEILAESIGLMPCGKDTELFFTAHPLRSGWQYAGITWSGGVADFIYNEYDVSNPYPYGDIGTILGNQIRKCKSFNQVQRMLPKETIRATVVGAGSNAVDISGSTIAWNDISMFPVQNVPIVKMAPEDEADSYSVFASKLAEKISWFKDEAGIYQLTAIAFTGVHNPSFDLIKDISLKIIDGLSDYLKGSNPLILIIENDMAKSLGYSLMNALPDKRLVALDSIKVDTGDYIDIGLPASAGRVIPVVVKTLVFGK
jgi:ethanolamine utilization protein EutA